MDTKSQSFDPIWDHKIIDLTIGQLQNHIGHWVMHLVSRRYGLLLIAADDKRDDYVVIAWENGRIMELWLTWCEHIVALR